MNRLIARVKNIESKDLLNIVKFQVDNYEITMLSLELSDNIKVESSVVIGFKPNKVVVGKDISGILSFPNQIDAEVVSIEKGELLCKLELAVFKDTIISTIFTKKYLEKMSLKAGDSVTAFIKASDISVLEVLS